MNKLFGLANPTRFRKLARPVVRIASVGGVVLLLTGLYYALFNSPPDYLQKETVRIMYIHVPAAWFAMLSYASLAAAALSYLVWKHTLAGLYIRAAAPVGAAFTLVCLLTGSLWGKPTWGTWWVWDARLTSVLILLFLFFGIMALADAYDNRERGLRGAAWLSLIGFINLPVIKFSVDWWNTLHQPASLTSLSRLKDPAIHDTMLTPLLLMAGAYLCLFVVLVLVRLDSEMMERKIETDRIRKVVHG